MSRLAPVLETRRLRLRGYTRDDFEWFHEAWLDEEVNRYTGQRKLSRSENWGRFLQNFGHWELLGYGYWMVETRDGALRLGMVGLMHGERGIESIDPYPETGWVFVPAAFGHGYATEAMQVVLGWADDTLDAPRTGCIIEEQNVASLRVADKLGYAYLGPVPFGGGEILVFTRPRRGART